MCCYSVELAVVTIIWCYLASQVPDTLNDVTEQKYVPPKNLHWDDLSTPEFPISSNAWSLIMLEAWRRGLKVEVGRDRRFQVSSSETSVSFRLNRVSSPQANKGAEICNDKHEAKQYFQRYGLPTPRGQLFTAPLTKDEVVAAANKMGFPLCLKAANWSKGKGVFPGIENEAQLQRFLNVLVDDLQCRSIILEENFDGDDFRFFVVGNKVSGVIWRVPANIEGDGVSTVKELIESKNRLRSRNPYLKGALIDVDDEIAFKLEKQEYTLDSVPPLGETLFLREKSNASAGGDSIDVTELVSSQSKDIAIKAIKAIPGLAHGGVDLLIQNPFTNREVATLIEVNQSAEMGLHLYPAYGAATYPPGDLVDYYFPDHVRQPNSVDWYFDLRSIFSILKSGAAESVVVKPMPKTRHLVWRQLTVKLAGAESEATNRLVETANRYSLHGTCQKTSPNIVSLKLCGANVSFEKFCSKLKLERERWQLQVISNEPDVAGRIVPGVRARRSSIDGFSKTQIESSTGSFRRMISKLRMKLPRRLKSLVRWS